MEPLEQRHARHTPTDDRHPWMVHENKNEAFMMLGPFFQVSTSKYD
jgi:hypothetical protein